MIAAKAALLDRENQSEVEKYNKLLEDYYNLLFQSDDVDLSKKDKSNIEDLMKGFRKNVAGKDLGTFRTDTGTFRGSDFSGDVMNLGQYAKEIKSKTKENNK